MTYRVPKVTTTTSNTSLKRGWKVAKPKRRGEKIDREVLKIAKQVTAKIENTCKTFGINRDILVAEWDSDSDDEGGRNFTSDEEDRDCDFEEDRAPDMKPHKQAREDYHARKRGHDIYDRGIRRVVKIPK